MLGRDEEKEGCIIMKKIIKNIEDFKYEDIEIVDYKFHPPIKGNISI